MTLDGYSVAYATSALICLLVSWAAWKHRPAPGAAALAVLCFAQFLWSSIFALQWTLTDHGPSLAWLIARLVPLQIMPSAILAFCLDFTGRRAWLTKRNLALLAIQPVLVLALAATDPLHGMYLGGLEPTLRFINGGPALLVNLAYSYALNLISAGLLLSRLERAQPYRTQTLVIIVAVMLPVAQYVLQVIGIEVLPGINSVPFTLTLTGLLMWYALSHLGLFQVLPVARDYLFEQMTDGIVVFDARRRIADINPAAMRLLGAPSTCLGMTADEAFPEHAEAIDALRSELLAGRPRPTVRTVLPHDEIVDVTASIVFKGSGERIATLITLRDVTAQARAAEEIEAQGAELVAARERSTRILEAMTEGVVLLDADCHVVQHNPAAARLLDPYVGPLDGASICALLPALSVAELTLRAIESGEPVAASADMPDGRSLTAEVIPLAEAGTQETQALLILRDETERLAAERMQRDFIANAAHELQTPLTGLSLLAETMPRVLERDPAAAAAFVQRLSVETQRLVRMATSLLNLSSIEDSGADVRRDAVDLSRLVADETEALQQMAASRGQNVRVHAPHGLVLEGHEVDLRAIVGNLLENALFHTAEGATVSLALNVSDDAGEPMMTITVADDGDGIPPEDLERIFERFYRVDKARARKTGGAGLGLSIVRAAVERHRGSIEVQSAPGAGSTFTVRLPVAHSK